MKRTCLLAVCVGIVLACAQGGDRAAAKAPKAPKVAKPAAKRRRNPVFAKIKDAPNLPRVLLIGDSISIGYTLATRKLLAGKANVHRIPTNGGPTTRGLASLEDWLGKQKWDVIHFNWGLHDLKYMGPGGGLDLKGTQQVPPEKYAKNLTELVKRLRATGARLIWASTTPVPAGAGGRIKGDAAKYNKIAAKIMAARGVAVNDLYAFALPRLKDIQRPRNVHFTPAGSKALAEQVADSILKALARPDFASLPRSAKGKFILDRAGMIDPGDEQKIRRISAKLLADKATPIVVVTISSMADHGAKGMRIETFARLLFNHWGIGQAKLGGKDWNTGILLVVSKGDRRARIELGAGWKHEKDDECQKIMDEEIVPRFKKGEFSAGILTGVIALDKLTREHVKKKP